MVSSISVGVVRSWVVKLGGRVCWALDTVHHVIRVCSMARGLAAGWIRTDVQEGDRDGVMAWSGLKFEFDTCMYGNRMASVLLLRIMPSTRTLVVSSGIAQ